MPQTGQITNSELTERLLKVSEAEMQIYHKKRMKKYRSGFFLAVGCGIVGGLLFFLLANFRWISAIFAVLGFLILGYSGFERVKWKRLYGKMIYLKQSREKTLQDMEKIKHPHKTKFQK